jgi:RNA polymerase sigma factor (sigma-70 family)
LNLLPHGRLFKLKASKNDGDYMEELTTLVKHARQGDSSAYEQVVRRFQDMAVGYAYSLMGDWQDAEDVAQDAFIYAYYSLTKLRDVAAFPGWFRRIVFTQANRRLRVKQPILVSIDQVAEVSASHTVNRLDQQDIRDEIDSAMETLSDHARTVVLLYYMNDYSQKEIATFLEVPLGTVKTRLHHARKQMKMRISSMANLSSQRPSRDNQFTEKVMRLFDATKTGNTDLVKTLLADDQSLAQASGFVKTALWGSDAHALHVATMHGRKDIIDLLLANGADINVRDEKYHFTALMHAIDLADFMPDYAALNMVDFLLERGAEKDVWACWWMGDKEAVKIWLGKDPSLVNQIGPGTSTLLSYCSGIEPVQFLLDYGADPLQSYDRPNRFGKMTPLRDMAIRGNYEVMRYLLKHLDLDIDLFFASIMGNIDTVKNLINSDMLLVTAKTPDDHILGAGLSALHLAAQGGHSDLVQWLLQQGANINATAYHDYTALHFVICYGPKKLHDPLPSPDEWSEDIGVYHMLTEIPQLLIDNGADLTMKDSERQLTPLALAMSHFDDETNRGNVINLLKDASVAS